MGNPQQRIEEVIFPFGFWVENLQSVDNGWVFQIKKSDSVYNCWLKDMRDEPLQRIAEELGVIQ